MVVQTEAKGRETMMLVFLLIHFLLLAAAVAAAVFGLWGIALIDLAACLAVAAGLKAAGRDRYVTMRYSEIARRMDYEPLPAPVMRVEEAPRQPEEVPEEALDMAA